MRINDTSDLGHCSLKLVIYHNMVGNSSTNRFFGSRFSQPFRDYFGVIPPTTKPFLLDFPAWGFHEDQNGIRIFRPDLFRTLHIDL